MQFSARESADYHVAALHFGRGDLLLPFRQLLKNR